MVTRSPNADARLHKLNRWLVQVLGEDDFKLEPASTDASFRRYFRVTRGNKTWIAMDAPPARENSRAFIQVAALLREAGLHAPRIYAENLAEGYLLLEDLGRQTYLQALTDAITGARADPQRVEALFADAVAALLDWQTASAPGLLPDYDADTLAQELQLFPDWFLRRHLRLALGPQEAQDLAAAFQHIVARVMRQGKGFVHRDYMPRNLMISDPNPGVLDFQDARYGPITYDVVSLFQDAFLSWPAPLVTLWRERYWRAARERGLPVASDWSTFCEDCDWMALQRHLKVLGIFARIRYRDGKPHYLDDAGRFVAYIVPVLSRYPELAPLAALFERHVVPGIAA